MWSFVFRRKDKRWVWLAQCRRTRQIVAYVIGDRSEKACALLWRRIPKAYKRSFFYSDFREAYQKVLPDEQHEATGNGAGQTCHIERFNNIIRHHSSEARALRQEDALILEVRPDARNVLADISERAQPDLFTIDHYRFLPAGLTTLDAMC